MQPVKVDVANAEGCGDVVEVQGDVLQPVWDIGGRSGGGSGNL